MKQKQDDSDKKQQGTMPDTNNEAEAWKNKYIRALADYQNLTKRTEEEVKTREKFAAQLVIEKLLPIFDTFELAEHHLHNEGLQLALKDLEACLQSFGVEKISAHGKPFDPYTMDCVDVTEGEEDIVKKVTVPGYLMHGKVIRAAKVIVGKKSINV